MSVLEEILLRKRADVAKRMSGVSYRDLREKTVPTTRSLAAALKKTGHRFILECKKASPSEGVIRENFDVHEIAGVYKNFADAVSVLTDEPYFQGGFNILRSARELLDLPILAKDFVLGRYQVCEARFYGADAALLMLSVLDDAAYKACADEARRLSMDFLTEVHSEEEAERAIRLNAPIIGINNRDLKTLKVDLGVTSRLAEKIRKSAPGSLIVCESGIRSREDVLAIKKNHADAFLVGSSLMKAERLDLAVRRLIYGGVKICGLTSTEDAAKAYEAGAVFGGVIFADSPRRVDENKALEIYGASPLPLVGVFVDEEIQKISRIASAVKFSAVQLHGEESEEYTAALRKVLPETCEIWKAVRVPDTLPDSARVYAESVHINRLLLDAFDKEIPDRRGGTGKTFDWETVNGFPDKSKIILAGGVGPDNARRASELGCFAIDVNSGVERVPGEKDGYKIENLFKNIRGEE